VIRSTKGSELFCQIKG